MARGKSNGGAKRGPKPKATRADLDELDKKLSNKLNKLTKLVKQLHVEVVPNSTEGTPDPELEPVVIVTEPVVESSAAEVIPLAEVIETPLSAPVTVSVSAPTRL